MKKLISILLMLMVLISGIAMAESTDAPATEAPTAAATEAPAEEDTAAPAEDETAAPEDDIAETDSEVQETKNKSTIDWSQVSRMNKGLIVTAGGLGGVFLVLILFFLMIKVMGKLLK